MSRNGPVRGHAARAGPIIDEQTFGPEPRVSSLEPQGPNPATIQAVRRRLLAVSLAIAVPVGALCAPLVHAHPDDHHDGHHGASRVHSHLAAHGIDHTGPTAHDIDHHHVRLGAFEIEAGAGTELVTRVQFFVADQPNDLIPIGLLPLGFALPAPLESVMRRPPVVSHSHDPPLARSGPSRAPPAILS